VAELDGPAPALALLDELELDNFHLYHAARADMLHRLGRVDEAAVAYDRSIDLATNAVERDHLQLRREELTAP
jgi:RNA polymerase sigma-70 factor (ECF subfamily)